MSAIQPYRKEDVVFGVTAPQASAIRLLTSDVNGDCIIVLDGPNGVGLAMIALEPAVARRIGAELIRMSALGPIAGAA